MSKPGDEQHNKRRKKRRPEEYSQVIREHGPRQSPLATFMVMPKNVGVEVQDAEEEILLVTRRHVITNVKWIVVALLMFLVPFFWNSVPALEILPSNFRLMTAVLWYLITTALVLEGFFNWYFDVFVVTDERIIDVDFRNLIYKNITTTKIDKIEDVTYNVSGAGPSLLDYGNVLIQTAGTGVVY